MLLETMVIPVSCSSYATSPLGGSSSLWHQHDGRLLHLEQQPAFDQAICTLQHQTLLHRVERAQ
jgi:hypothetical protein